MSGPTTFVLRKNGGYRRIDIPTAIERVEQKEILELIQPIYEPHFNDFNFGFRMGKGPKRAVNQFVEHIEMGFHWIAYIDIVDCFPSINPTDAAKHIDSRLVILDPRRFRGLPQGHPISPFLSNVYLDQFDKTMEKWVQSSRFRDLDLRVLRYVDDVWLMARKKRVLEHYASRAIEVLGGLGFSSRMQITHVNQGVDILGFTVLRRSIGPSTKSFNKLRQRLIRIICHALESDSDTTNEAQSTPGINTSIDQDHITKYHNLRTGWSNYFGDEAWNDAMEQMPTLTAWLAMMGFLGANSRSET